MRRLLLLVIMVVSGGVGFAQSPQVIFNPDCSLVTSTQHCCWNGTSFVCGTGAAQVTFSAVTTTAGNATALPRFSTNGSNLEASPLKSDAVHGNLGLRVAPSSSYGLYILDGNTVTGDNADIMAEKYGASLSGPSLITRHARGNVTTPAVAQANDIPITVTGYAWARDAANTADAWVQVGGIRTSIEALDAEGRLAGRTEIIGSSGVSAVPVVKLRVTANGSVMAGNTVTGTPTADLDVFGTTFRLRTAKTPATATEACNAGTIVWDTGFVYVCTSTNAWKRAALATW